jgi:class 3 adenylate cyclase
MSAEGSITCARCGSANPSGSRFCNGCGARLEAAPPPQETRRTVTVLFADVAGSTALGERLDPEPLRALIGQYFDLAKVVIERHGGTVEKFIGDAVMAVFGLPVLHEDDALRAVRAARELQERLTASSIGDRVVTRIGVNTGPVVAADTDDAQRLVTGDAVNTAARLEQHAPLGGILLGAGTYRLVRDAVTAEEVESVAAKGKAEPVRAWRLVSVDPAGEGTARRLDAPLVGRDRELKRLLRSYEDAVAERRCGLFTLLGPAGVGKSRLVFELVSRVRGESTVLRGRCLPYGEGITYWPIAEIVRTAAGIDEQDAIDGAIAKIHALVATEADADEITDRLAGAIGLAAGDAPREEVFRAVRRLFEVLAAARPLVVVVDALQWAEATLLDLIEHLVDWSRGLPILVVTVARPELLDARPAWGSGKLDSQQVLLEGLRADDVRSLATALLGADVDAALLARIESVAEGNPLFVEQLVAMLIEDAHLVRDGAGWRATSDLAAIHVPPTISALLAARLDRLPAEERHVAERASVVGRIFERTAVTELSPAAERDEVSARFDDWSAGSSSGRTRPRSHPTTRSASATSSSAMPHTRRCRSATAQSSTRASPTGW